MKYNPIAMKSHRILLYWNAVVTLFKKLRQFMLEKTFHYSNESYKLENKKGNTHARL